MGPSLSPKPNLKPNLKLKLKPNPKPNLSRRNRINSTLRTKNTNKKHENLCPQGTRRACAAREQAVAHASLVGLRAQLALVTVQNVYDNNQSEQRRGDLQIAPYTLQAP